MRQFRILAVLFALLIPACAWAQSCEQSFNIKPDKSVVNFAWLIEGNQAGLTVLSCPVAEDLRQKLFLGGVGSINQDAFNNLQAYKNLVKARRDALIADRDALRKALNENSATKIIVEVALYELGKVLAILGCVTPEPTMASKALCALELGLVAKDTHEFVQTASGPAEMQKRLTLINQQIAKTDQEFTRVMNLASSAGLPVALQKRKQMFDSLCLAIRQSCL